MLHKPLCYSKKGGAVFLMFLWEVLTKWLQKFIENEFWNSCVTFLNYVFPLHFLKILQIEVHGEESLLTFLDGASKMFPGAVTAFWGDLATVASSIALCQGRMNSLLFVLTFHCEWRGWALVLSGWAGVLHKEAKPAGHVSVSGNPAVVRALCECGSLAGPRWAGEAAGWRHSRGATQVLSAEPLLLLGKTFLMAILVFLGFWHFLMLKSIVWKSSVHFIYLKLLNSYRYHCCS